MNIIYMGTPDFAVPSLQRILDDGHNVTSVFTQPDKPKGRGYKLMPPPVKELAEKYNIPVYQPLTLKDEELQNTIKEQNPDVIVVVAYGRILPKAVLDIPKYGCVNVHASLLPKYRGAGPIQWSVINGETVAGVTTMYMGVGLDTGDMILKAPTPIESEETAGELHDRLSRIGAQTISDTLKLIESGDAPRIPQNDEESCYAPMLDKSIAELDFSKTAKELHNLVRGLSPWPVAFTRVDGKILKVHRAVIAAASGEEGTVVNDKRFIVACKNGALEFTEVQYEGGKRMSAEQFLRGHRIEKGTKLG